MTTEPKTNPEPEKKLIEKPAFDPTTLSDEDFAKIFSDERIWKNDRFKELNEEAKKGRQLTKLQEQENEKKLLEEKKYQEVIDAQKKQIEELEGKVTFTVMESVIKAEAQKLGVVDAEVVAKLIDRTNVKVNPDGSITGVAEAVKSLTDSKPYLLGKPATTTIGTGTNPGNGGNASPKFKLSQLQDASFYQANEKEITEALKNNMVENDMNMGK